MDTSPHPINTQPPSRATFSTSFMLRITRSIFPILSVITPRLTSRIALKLFLTPPRHKTPKRELAYLENSNKGQLTVGGKTINTYVWGEGPRTIVMCHSWGGRGSQLGAFIPELTSLGFRVVTFDAPAHGTSEGQQTDMMEYSLAIAEIVSHFGPVFGLIGHSFGAGNAMFSWHRFKFAVERIALIGCFSNATWVTERFGELVGIPQKVIARMRSQLEHQYQGELCWDSLSIGKIAREFTGSLMLVHDQDDAEIPYFHAEELLKTSARQEHCLLSTKGLGHRRIVRDSDVVKAVAHFFERPVE